MGPGARVGRFEILGPLGVDSLSQVYRAVDRRLGRVVALKILDSQMLDQAEREAKTISRLNHPNICQVYDVGHDDGIDYLVMEYVEGVTLAERRQQSPLPPPDVLRIATEVVEALCYAHRRAIVHGDLKPGNVMLTARGVKLLLFGLARSPANIDIVAFGTMMVEIIHGTEMGLPAGVYRLLRDCASDVPPTADVVLQDLQRINRRARARTRRLWLSVLTACVILAAGVLFLANVAAPRAHMEILYSFTGTNGDGVSPERAGVTMDAAGTLYGVTVRGGVSGQGTVYKVAPPARGGAWRERVIHSFAGPDGARPSGAPVIGSDGSLYGTTTAGGEGHGVVFRLTPPATPAAPWTQTVLHRFTPQTGDGASPQSGVILDRSGALYGTTRDGGVGPSGGAGIVYCLTPPSGLVGEWKETLLHRFGEHKGDCNSPYGELVFGKDGALYGTTFGCGGVAIAFRLSPPAAPGDSWEETIFPRPIEPTRAGEHPTSGLALGKNGELYGTTHWGGIGQVDSTSGNGTVFQLTPSTTPWGRWSETVLYEFGSHPGDGAEPLAGLVVGPAGELYGTAQQGGVGGNGIIFKLEPPRRTGGTWTESVLYSFGLQAGSGLVPQSNPHLIFGRDGALFGTTAAGGAFGKGTVFRLVLSRR